jgi:predicted AAA+ superfamily ATPase
MKLYSRENYLKKIRGFYHADDIIKVITGVRRCGKSSLMATIADEIIQSGVPEENIIYIDLDLRPNKGIKTADQLESLILKKGTAPGRKYLFVDEIQNVTDFEEVINGFRSEGGCSSSREKS